MDVKIALFIHVVCVATWFGGTAFMAMYLRDSIRSNSLETMSYSLGKAQRWNLMMMIPTAVLVLATGIYMLMQFASKDQLWIVVKERFGSLVIVLFIVLIAFYGKKLLKKVQASGIDLSKAQAHVKRYILIHNISLLFMIVLIFFVTVKIA
ncbi:hypothetical protein [Hazenella coriacea]|uniref:Copper resistance protein D n=1 Tax=Hazenella coriacea TaxID=1179467 RepID=A0A4R3L257_9BACL|nr:hypothetical protein [Hazenella coriacea]TCS93262.1 hypothetical protein EDD58_10877 [Hazenella coriacea]